MMMEYKVSLMRYGYVVVKADSKEEAAQKALACQETDIHWLSEADGLEGPYLVVLAEPAAGVEPAPDS